MANFCTRCGRPLQAGEVCSCGSFNPQQMNMRAQAGQRAAEPQAQMAQQQGGMNQGAAGPQGGMNPNMAGNPMYGGPQGGMNPNMAAYASPASVFFNRIWGTFLRILKAPVTGGIAFMQTADIKMASVFVVLQSLLSGLWSMASTGAMIRAVGGRSYYGDYIPYGRMFVVTALLTAAFIYLLAAVVMLATMTLGQKFTYAQILCGISVRSVLLIPALLVSILLSQIFVVLGAIAYLLACVWSIFAMFFAVVSVIEMEKRNRFTWVVTLFLTVYLVVYFICSMMSGIGTIMEAVL